MSQNGNRFIINDPYWYKDAVIYQLHVKAFMDSNGDGIGDFIGMTHKLDYIQSLGVTAIWLLPFYPSPLRDDGYDIADYTDVHPSYGTMRDFKAFLKEAHKRGLRVITELVLNHTSDQHVWFKRSRNAPAGSPWREYYVWSDTADKYNDARIIFKDFETSNWSWDSTAQAYFWHRFYSHQPDLNYENPEVHSEMLRIIDFWLDMGVDGMRLDAVPYLYERDGTNCENLPETLDFLRKVRSHIDSRYKDRMLLAEANQWPEDAARYFGQGDICHMAFHFPIMPRMFMALQMEDWFPLIDIMEQTKPIPESCQWAIFLRNHDELTLEMVTEEERDYMYRCYANDPTSRINLGIRRRLAPLLRNSRRRIEIMNTLLFSLPGTPIIYYGDEIGMGDNHYLGDRNGVRTPMQWNADRNAGFSMSNPQRLFLPIIIDPEYHYEALNVETQEQNTSSLLWWMKRIISMRCRFKAFARGDIEFIKSDNANVLTFIRKYEDEAILVIVNLSRFSQAVSLDLRSYTGFVPKDIFSGNRFPAIHDTHYVVTMGFHDYFWLILENEENIENTDHLYTLPDLAVKKCWTELFSGKQATILEKQILPTYLKARKTAGCKPMPVLETTIFESFSSETAKGKIVLLFINVKYPKGITNMIMLPLSRCSSDSVESAVKGNTGMILAMIDGGDGGYIYDCSYDTNLHQMFLKLMTTPRRLAGKNGVITGHYRSERIPRSALKNITENIHIHKTGPYSSSFNYDDTLHFKLYRQMEDGIHPNLELTQFLSDRTEQVTSVPHFIGALEYRGSKNYIVIGILSRFVNNTGTAWTLSLDAAVNFFESIIAQKIHDRQPPPVPYTIFDANPSVAPAHLIALVGNYSEKVRLIGKKTAELHCALASESINPNYSPEPFTTLYQRSLYQSMRTISRKIISELRSKIPSLPNPVSNYALTITENEKLILQVFEVLLTMKPSSYKIRVHGDYQLEQLLHIGNDFVITDFSGQAGTALSERRIKRSPLRDIAGILNSFNCVALTALYQSQKMLPVSTNNLHRWADLWTTHVANLFLDSYIDGLGSKSILLSDKQEMNRLLKLFVLEKSLTNLGLALKTNGNELPIAIRAVSTALNAVVETNHNNDL